MKQTFKGHEFEIRIHENFAYIYVDGKCQFRVKYPQKMTPERYAQQFITNRYK